MQLREFEPFKGKTIVKIAAGHNFYLALQRNVEKIEDWDIDRVVRWLRDIGFNSFVQIAMAEKLTGKKLLTIERKYMQNILGITKINMQQKFLMSIEEQLNSKQYEGDRLYGWGKNEYGQLGSSSANFITNPQRIKLPNLKETEYIDSIYCGWQQTFIRTQKGRIHSTIRNVEKKKER